MKNILISFVVIATVLLVIPRAVPEANGGTYDVTKTVIWETDEPTAYYDYFYHVFANDKHNPPPPVHQDNPMTNPQVNINVADQLRFPNIFNGQVVKSPHCRWTGNTPIGTATPGSFSTGLIGVSSVHPDSNAMVSFDFSGLKPTTIPNSLYKNMLTASMNVTGSATVANIPISHAPETAFADSSAGAYIQIAGWLNKGDVNESGRLRRSLRGGNIHSVGLTAYSSSKPDTTSYNDPMHLTIMDEETQEIIAENDLCNENWLVQGNASAEWGDNGLILQVYDSQSNAFAVFETLSDWVLNPFNGTASIADGIFSATGDLANLAWEISAIGDHITATLPLSELGREFDLEILPDGLGTPEHDLLAILDIPSIPYTDDYKTIDIPEPAIITMLTLGGLALLRKRK